MRNMLSSFVMQKQEKTFTAFCNYLVSEMEGLEEKDFQTFRSDTVKLLSSIQSKAEECCRQPQQPEQWTLLGSSSATSTSVPQIFQPLQEPALPPRKYILIISNIKIPASQAIHLFSRAK